MRVTRRKRSAEPDRSRSLMAARMTQLISTLICPQCGEASTETMPTDACQYFYDCPHCAAFLKPLAGDCCVFCSYGDVPCPPIQQASESGSSTTCCGG